MEDGRSYRFTQRRARVSQRIHGQREWPECRDGYNVGLRYQCVEFVKRYYSLEHYAHRMPNSYGHAKDLFDPRVEDGAMNAIAA